MKYRHLLCLSPDGDAGQGAGQNQEPQLPVETPPPALPNVVEGVFGENQAATITPVPQEQTPPVAPAAPGVDVNTIADAVAKGLITAQQQQAAVAAATPSAPPQMTPEEFKKLVNHYELDQDTYDKIFSGGPEGIAAFNAAIQGAVRNAASLAIARAQLDIDGVRNEVNPVIRTYQQKQTEEIKTAFYGEHADLKPYEFIVDKVSEQLAKSGWKGSTPQEVYAKVAEESRKVMKQMNLQGGSTPAGAGTPTSKTTMPTLSAGGQGGIGKSAGKPQAKSDTESIFG